MRGRTRLLAFLLIFCFFIIYLRLFSWQVLHHQRLNLLAKLQYRASQKVPTRRGKIFFHDNFPLVLNEKSFLLYADPHNFKISPVELEEKLAKIVPEIKLNFNLLSNQNLFWVPLINNLDQRSKEEIEKLNIVGLGFAEQEKRFYSEASMSAHLLGFVAEDERQEKRGYFGIEGFYDKELKGRSGIRYFDQDALGRPLPWLEEEEESIPGRDLVLHLNRQLQFLSENHLRKGIEKYKASGGSTVIMDPKSGAILALASFPAYDPAEYSRYNPDLYRNPVISSVFEPGSIFKVVVMASALDSQSIRPEETCRLCSGPRVIADYSIRTWNEKYYPDSSLTDIIVHSDNVGMVYVTERTGREHLYEYLKKFGFGEKTGIDLEGEALTSLREKQDWQEIDLATLAFGQGIAVTPIQMLSAISVIASGGDLFQPRVVKSIIEGEKVIITKPWKKRKVISRATAKMVTEMMVQAVEKGEAKWARPKGYKIAGKTGTAQIPITGHYDPEKTIASFIGFAPADDPKFAMLVILQEPQTSPWGSETAAPLWFAIARDIFRVWNIKPVN